MRLTASGDDNCGSRRSVFRGYEPFRIAPEKTLGGTPRIVPPGIVDFVDPIERSTESTKVEAFYSARVQEYEENLHLTFATHGDDEESVRSEMIRKLNLESGAKVLEIAAGTGRDSVLIYRELGDDGELHITDVSLEMLIFAEAKFLGANRNVYFARIDAGYSLPFADNYFDAAYSFGGLGEFPNPRLLLSELARVVRVGGKIVVGDESLPVWHRKSEFGRILANYNPQFLADVPFSSLPVEARHVRCSWIIGGTFYCLDFAVGDGEPKADFDFEIPGHRGGTHRTRYYGVLEGVTSEAKQLAIDAARTTGMSMHKWLDRVVREAAERDLD